MFSKRTSAIPVERIYQVRKPTNVLVVATASTALIAGGYLGSQSIGYFLPGPIQWAIPAIAYAYIDSRWINPMKTVNERFYYKDNRWVMQVE